MSVYSKISGIISDINKGVYDKECELKLALLAAIAGESILLLGPPGVAKSMIARSIKNVFRDANSFEYLMSRFSTPDEVFGPVSIAKLKDSEKAFHFVKSLLTYTAGGCDGTFKQSGGVYTNLFDAHPPFQIDGNFGIASGIGLMIVQKEDDIIKLLPALPKELSKKGRLCGMKLKGGISLDLKWENGKVTSAYLTAKRDCTEKVLYDGKLTNAVLKAGEKTKVI